MRTQSFAAHLRGTTSILALSATALFALPAGSANAQVITQGIYAGGSTLAAKTFRNIFDCYMGVPLQSGCTVTPVAVEGMVAGVGDGNGMRGYFINRAAEWYGGSVMPDPSISILINTPFPAPQPPFVDSGNPNFGTYPYPRVDIGLAETPLPPFLAAFTTTAVGFTPAAWQTPGGALAQITLLPGSQIMTYSTATYGQPIQVPAFEINVAIAVNTQGLTVNSAVAGTGTLPATQANQGAAIQLTTAQMCAIFSGLVSDWNDTIPNHIPLLTSTGLQLLGAFNDANNIGSTLTPYSTVSTPIKVVYNADESGETFILTNYLKNVCPLLDPNDTFRYRSIFSAANLPTTKFTNLISNINVFRVAGSAITSQWIGARGSGGVAATVGTGAANGGRIGYVGANFTKPYAQFVSGAGLTNVDAPFSAALQNEHLRISGVALPDNATPTTLEFIAPTADGANAAWNDTRLQSPVTTWTWADYNIYNNTFTSTTTQGGVMLLGQSVLPLTNVVGAYPLSGTSFMELYSCYNIQADANRATNLRNFLSWYFDPSNVTVSGVVQNEGFNPVPASYASLIRAKYLSLVSPSAIGWLPFPVAVRGCAGVVGGAL